MDPLTDDRAEELLRALGLSPTRQQIEMVLTWGREVYGVLSERMTQLTWLLEQHQGMLDVVFGEGGDAGP